MYISIEILSYHEHLRLMYILRSQPANWPCLPSQSKILNGLFSWLIYKSQLPPRVALSLFRPINSMRILSELPQIPLFCMFLSAKRIMNRTLPIWQELCVLCEERWWPQQWRQKKKTKILPWSERVKAKESRPQSRLTEYVHREGMPPPPPFPQVDEKLIFQAQAPGILVSSRSGMIFCETTGSAAGNLNSCWIHSVCNYPNSTIYASIRVDSSLGQHPHHRQHTLEICFKNGISILKKILMCQSFSSFLMGTECQNISIKKKNNHRPST